MRKRTGKKIFSAIAACLLAVTGNFPAMAAEIKKVRLRLTAEDFDESGRPEAEFQTVRLTKSAALKKMRRIFMRWN